MINKSLIKRKFRILQILIFCHVSFSFCNEAKPINIDSSNSAAGILLDLQLPDLLGQSQVPSGLPSVSTGSFFDGTINDVTLTYSEPMPSDTSFHIAIVSHNLSQTPAITGYANFTVFTGETTHLIGFNLPANDLDCLDGAADRVNVSITRDSDNLTHTYSFVVKDGDYCIFETGAKIAANLGGLATMDLECRNLAANKGLPGNPGKYKAMVGALSASQGNRDPGETLSATSLFRDGKRYVRKTGTGSWVKLFEIAGSWPPSSSFDNPLIDSGSFWTGMHSGWHRSDGGTCLNDLGTESWLPETSSGIGNIGSSSVSEGDSAYFTVNSCSSGGAQPFLCVYSP